MNLEQRKTAVRAAEHHRPAPNERYCESCKRWRVPVLGRCQKCQKLLVHEGELERIDTYIAEGREALGGAA